MNKTAKSSRTPGGLRFFVLRSSVVRPSVLAGVVSAVAIAEVLAVVAVQGTATTTDWSYAIPRLVLAGLTLVAARGGGLGLGAERVAGVRHGLLLGWPAFVVMALALISGALSAGRFSGWSALAVFTISMVSVGVFEEVLFRGVLLGAIHRALRGRSAALRAALLSSAVFGVAHLVNLPRQSLGPTIAQVAYAALIGVFFAAVRLRSGSLIAVIVLHTLLDSSFYLGSDVFERAGSTQGPAMVTVLILVLVGLLLATWGVRLLRRPSPLGP